MLSLLRFYFRLCLLREKPQDLPASQALLMVTAAANIFAGTASVTPTLGSPVAGFLASLLDTILLTGFIWFLLNARRIGPRFLQTATAALGVSLVITGLSLPLQLFMPNDIGEPAATAETASLLFLLLVIWLQVALGNVLRHAIESNLLLGVGLAFVYAILSGILIQSLFLPGELATGSG